MLRSILQDLFGDLSHGRLQRIPFALYILGGLILLFPLIILFGTTLGALGKSSGIDFRWAIYPFIAVVAFVASNLTAKRIRDIGLPGWTTLVVVNVLITAMMYVGPEQLVGALNASILLALIFAPSDTIKIKPLDA
jgi:uncharacterized membrane protein YhaH (DUF805 family)